MEQQWIAIRDAAALTQKPERTLRYQAAQGKIESKKQGQNWLIDLNSLKKSGLIKVLPPPLDSAHKAQFENSVEDTAAIDSVKPGESQKYDEHEKSKSTKSPRDLASYRALFSWRNNAAAACPSCLPLVSQILKNLAAGYFEFSRDRKAEFYHHARELLGHLWVELELLTATTTTPNESISNSAALKGLSQRLCSDVIPALSGALKKIEGKAKKQERD